jgi:site-specific recombinase XerD
MNKSGQNHLAVSDKTGKLIKASIAPSTVETYRVAMQHLEIWLDGHSLSDNRLADYITALYQDGKSPSTISKIVAAVKWTVKNHGVGAKDLSFEITEKALAGIRRKGKDRGRGQVDGITWEEVERICALAEAEGTVAGLRDSALIRLMSDCLLRISEAVAVDVADVDSVLTVHQSKTNPGTTGIPDVTLYIGAPTQEAIKRYCKAAGITEGPLFRWVRRGDNIADTRLTIDGVRKIIQRRAREAGVEGKISGHSLRIGSAVSLAQAGASVVNMQVAGRWKSPQMPAHYARAESAARGGIARFKYGK